MAARKKTATPKKRKVMARGSAASKRKVAPKAAKRATPKATKKASGQETRKVGGAINVGRKPFSKSQLLTETAAHAGVSRKETAAVMEAIVKIIAAHLQKNGPQIFSWPGLFKIKVINKPATKAREGVNPFTGEKMMFKAKPASRKPKVLPLKGLKEIVGSK